MINDPVFIIHVKMLLNSCLFPQVWSPNTFTILVSDHLFKCPTQKPWTDGLRVFRVQQLQMENKLLDPQNFSQKIFNNLGQDSFEEKTLL